MKALVLLAALVCASQSAAAQQLSGRLSAGAHVVRPVETTDDDGSPHKNTPSSPDAVLPPEKMQAAPVTPSDCDVQLAKVATVRLLGKLVAPGKCGAPDAVELESVILPDMSRVTVAPPATLRCEMATTVARWVREDVAPAAAKLGSPLRGLENLDSYECRTRDRVPGAPLSEHGRANALDVRSFKLADGRVLVLADPTLPVAFRDAVRLGACARFMTVLGPGSDGYHSEHVHIDLAPRRNNYKVCEWNVETPMAQTVSAKSSTQAKPARLGTPMRITPTVRAEPPIPRDRVPLPRPRPRFARAE